MTSLNLKSKSFTTYRVTLYYVLPVVSDTTKQIMHDALYDSQRLG